MSPTSKTLVRVLILGTLLAGILWAVRGPPGTKGTLPEVHISEAEVAHLSARWHRQWNRPPTREELQNAVDAFVRDEILYREALARGLDREDPTVRLALVQKMRMLAAGRADAQTVSEADLASFFALRKERYRIPATLSLVQVYFRDEGDPGAATERAAQVLARFRAEEPDEHQLAETGDAIMLETAHHEVTATDIERLFGADFAAEVLALPEGAWSGPIRSGYGLHLVNIFERIPGRIPDLDEVRAKVADDLGYENRKASEEQAYQEIAGKYRVVVTTEAGRLLEGETVAP